MRLLRFFLIVGLTVPGLLLSACLYKPARIMAPALNGLTCPTPTLCLEDQGEQDNLTTLQDAARTFVENRLGPFRTPPRVLFCATEACSEKFGMDGTSAFALGTQGILVHPKGREPHILRHEMIHHWQAETFGRYATSFGLPRWYIEGMAYALSEDPRQPLPRRDIEGWRRQFEAWATGVDDFRIPPR